MAAALLTGWRPSRSAVVYGRWVRVAGAPRMPEQLAIQRDAAYVTVRYFESGGLTTLRFLCDHESHPISDLSGAEGTYSAYCDARQVFVSWQKPLGIFQQQWGLSENGRILIVSGPAGQAIYQRPTLLQWLSLPAP